MSFAATQLKLQAIWLNQVFLGCHFCLVPLFFNFCLIIITQKTKERQLNDVNVCWLIECSVCVWTELLSRPEASAAHLSVPVRQLLVWHRHCNGRRAAVSPQCHLGRGKSSIQSRAENHSHSERARYCHSASQYSRDEDDIAVCVHRWNCSCAGRQCCVHCALCDAGPQACMSTADWVCHNCIVLLEHDVWVFLCFF